MIKKISNEFQWLLHISFLRKIVKDHPVDYIKVIKETGVEIGRRIVDDFCFRHSIFKKVPDSEIMKYLKIFLEFYFEKDIQIDGLKIIFVNQILKNQRNPGCNLFKEIIQTVFKCLNDNIDFEIVEDKYIKVNMLK